MKKKILMLLVIFATATGMSAQENCLRQKCNKREKTMMESTNALVIGQHGVTLQLENTNLVNIYLTTNNRFYLLAGNVFRLGYDGSTERGLVVPFCVAGGLGFSLINDVERNAEDKVKSSTTLDLQGLCKQTVFGCFNWKYTELDVALKMYLDRTSAENGFVFGVGYKFNKSHSMGVDDMNCWYISLGKSF